MTAVPTLPSCRYLARTVRVPRRQQRLAALPLPPWYKFLAAYAAPTNRLVLTHRMVLPGENPVKTCSTSYYYVAGQIVSPLCAYAYLHSNARTSEPRILSTEEASAHSDAGTEFKIWWY
eukprot:201651-Rhodomonas_salina.2